MRRLLAAVLLLLSTASLDAQYRPDPDYERVLVPVFWFGGGAGGSQWFSSFDLVSSEVSFNLAHPVLKEESSCEFFCPCELKAHVEQGKAETICGSYEDPRGMLIWVPRSVDRDTVHTSLRVLDKSREADRAGTQIPVVWERDFYSGGIVLLDVKTEPRYRSTLRLYDAFMYDTDFIVTFYDMAKYRRGDREVLFETTVRANAGTQQGPARFPLHPSNATIGNIVAQWPQLGMVDSVAIEVWGTHLTVSPPQYDKRFYALVSITNNVTQEVTTVSPR